MRENFLGGTSNSLIIRVSQNKYVNKQINVDGILNQIVLICNIC